VLLCNDVLDVERNVDSLAVCSIRNAHRLAVGRDCEPRGPSRRALGEECPSFAFENADEINALDELFVLGPYRVAEFAWFATIKR
jgi:hypothetical protein